MRSCTWKRQEWDDSQARVAVRWAGRATAFARTTGSDEESEKMVCDAATIIRDDAKKWGGIHERRRSKNSQELREDVEKPRATTRLRRETATDVWRDSETCFGRKVDFNRPMPVLAPAVQLVLLLFDGVEGNEFARLMTEMRCVYMFSTMLLKNRPSRQEARPARLETWASVEQGGP